jgi:hypothetical protein
MNQRSEIRQIVSGDTLIVLPSGARPMWIEVDDELAARLRNATGASTENPNHAPRRPLGRSRKRGSALATPSAAPRKPGLRLALPVEEYELPILKALSERGGTAHSVVVLYAVGNALADRLTPYDRKHGKNGHLRWWGAARYCQTTLVNRFILKPEGPGGIWELTEAGTRRLARLEAEREGKR